MLARRLIKSACIKGEGGKSCIVLRVVRLKALCKNHLRLSGRGLYMWSSLRLPPTVKHAGSEDRLTAESKCECEWLSVCVTDCQPVQGGIGSTPHLTPKLDKRKNVDGIND